MTNTTAKEVFDSFESSFEDKKIIPFDLELIWLKKAIGRYSVELEPLKFDACTQQFDDELNQYVIDTLAGFMRLYYQEREWSRVNKQISIVGKDISVNAGGHGNVAAKNEVEYYNSQSNEMVANQMPTAYS